jgi:hypothetical protein
MAITKPVNQIFDDLDALRTFCVEYGYKFSEKDLYDKKSFIYKSYLNSLTGKKPKNQWDIDKAKYKATQLGI